MVITCWRFPASVRWVPPQWMTSLPLLHHEIQPERQHSDHEKTQPIFRFFWRFRLVGNTQCISTCFMLTKKVMNAMGEVGVVGLFFCWDVRFVELWTVSWTVISWVLDFACMRWTTTPDHEDCNHSHYFRITLDQLWFYGSCTWWLTIATAGICFLHQLLTYL